MKQVLQNFRSGELEVADVPAPGCKPGQVLVRNLYSVVSAGTERHSVEFAQKNIVQKARARPDLVRKVLQYVRTDGPAAAFQLAMSRLDDWRPLGYSTSGTVIEVGEGVTDLSAGDLVACAGAGHANHAEIVAVPRNLVAPVPRGVDPRQAAFATLGAIALQGIHRANLTPGESVGVIGLGLIGQLTALMLKQYNMPVLGVDVNGKQVAATCALGIEAVTNPEAEAAARVFNGGRGLDAVIITAATASSDPVQLAGELSRPRGRVSAVGLVGMDIPRQLYYDKELDFFVSRSYGPGRYDAGYEDKGIDYPLGYVRWTENRNMIEFLRLLGAGMDLTPLITHTFEITEATQAYDLILNNRREYFLGVLFRYPQDTPIERKIALPTVGARPAESDVRLGVIGPGSFARATLLPVLRKMPGVSIIGVCSATGRSAQAEATASGAAYSTTDYQEILADPQVNTVLIATRHNLHARMAVDALGAGKNVLVEKPLALRRGELDEVIDAAASRPDRLLLVGYNRRFSTHSRRIKDGLAALPPPYMMHYRVNAGYIPPESWVHDPQEGGGRILGEVCHFVDLLQYFAGCDPVQVWAQPVKGGGDSAQLRDNVAITILFADGTTGSILYTALGPRSLAKERIEVFAGGQAIVLDNFRSSIEYGNSVKERRALSQDKGHAQMLAAAVEALRKGAPAPIPLRELALTSLTTFYIVESLETGRPIAVSMPTT